MKKQLIQQNTGAKTALIIGLPLGMMFSLAVWYISLFAPFDVALALLGGDIFWAPYNSIFIISAFAVLLWHGGIKIENNLYNYKSFIKTSFRFTLFVNGWLFSILVGIFIIGTKYFNSFPENSFNSIFIGIAILILIFILSTFLTTFTIGLIIVLVTKYRLHISNGA